MERKKASDFPQELLNLFDLYVHGNIGRREFMDGAKKFATGRLTVAAIFESLRPNYAWAEQVPKDDSRIKTEYVTVQSPDGNGSIKGYLARPASGGKQPGVLVVHENRGLNPYIEDVARRLATANFIAFAPDGLTSVGGYPGDDEKGAQDFAKVDRDKMLDRLSEFGEMVEGAAGLHRQNRSSRFLFWRRRGQSTGRPHGIGPCRRGSLLWRAADGRRRRQDQSAAACCNTRIGQAHR